MKLAIIKRLLAKGVLSPTLKLAVEESLKAIEEKNFQLAYQITACKSLIANKIDPKRKEFKNYAFQEDREKNEAVLKNSAYCLMDNFHFQIAMKVNAMPSGMTVVSSAKSGLAFDSMKSTGQHPIIKRIQYEKKLIAKECRR